MAPDASGGLFRHWTCAEGLKAVLHLPLVRVMAARRENGAFRILDNPPRREKCAFVGARPCDLAALAILDRVLLRDRYVDDIYRARRENAFLVAVHCLESALHLLLRLSGRRAAGHARASTSRWPNSPTAASRNTSPKRAPRREPTCWRRAARRQRRRNGAPGGTGLHARRRRQKRSVNAHAAPALIDALFESSHWDRVARRCLACGNCTMVCPTCFCVNYEDRSSLDGAEAERWRLWDSCFSQSFTYIHGGSVRTSLKSRYRQWFSHKLARWQAQFGTPGCTGCGRCIVWCPVGIDITQEFQELQAAAAAAVPPRE